MSTRHWTSEEETRLRDMLEAGSTADKIAAELNRSRAGIYSKIQRLYRKQTIRDIKGGVGRRAK